MMLKTFERYKSNRYQKIDILKLTLNYVKL